MITERALFGSIALNYVLVLSIFSVKNAIRSKIYYYICSGISWHPCFKQWFIVITIHSALEDIWGGKEIFDQDSGLPMSSHIWWKHGGGAEGNRNQTAGGRQRGRSQTCVSKTQCDTCWWNLTMIWLSVLESRELTGTPLTRLKLAEWMQLTFVYPMIDPWLS